MASAAYFCLALFILTGFVHVDADLKKFISLISKVHNYYGTSSVFFVSSRNNQYLDEYSLVHSLTREFSRKSIFTLIIDYEELDKRANWYRKRIGRPLIVILLESMSNIAEFNKNTESMNISYPIWLVIFTNEFSKLLCEYCKYPRGNIFRLRFDTEMLVLCCDTPMLKEWWAVYENRTEMSDFATWTKNEELTFLAPDGLYARRNDVKGAGLRIGIVTNSVFVREDNNEIEGFFGDVLKELKRAMNFTITGTVRNPGFGTWSSRTQRWTGIVGQLIRGEVDLGVADFTITNARLGVVDYTSPLAISRSRLYIRDRGSGVQWSAYFQAFTIKIWMAIMFLIITAPILLTVIKVHGGSTSLLSLVVENYLYVWGIFCQQGLCDFPVATSLRIAYFSIFVSALVVSAAYSASLVSFLTVSSSSLPFTTLEGFANDGSYKLIVYQNHADYDFFATASNPMLKKMMALMKPVTDLPETLVNGWDQVCQGKVALYTNEEVKQKSNLDIKCKVAGIDSGRTDSLAMIMPADSQYSKVINYHIQRFQDTGVIHRLRNKYFTESTSVESEFVVVNLWGVAPVLATLASGIILAFVVLFCEKMYYSLKNKLRSSERWKNLGEIKSRRRVNGKEQILAVKNLRWTIQHGKFSNSFARGYP